MVTEADGVPGQSVDEGPVLASVAPRPWAMLLRRGLLGMGVGVGIAILLVAGWLYPYFRDDRALDRVVRVVALDWRDFGEEEARRRLEYELDHAGIGQWVADRDCALSTDRELRIVRCGWTVTADVPGAGVALPLSFASSAELGPDGSLR
ncbi:MAG: hypothetical protein ABMB14_22565 [Myxococcota bacterium]